MLEGEEGATALAGRKGGTKIGESDLMREGSDKRKRSCWGDERKGGKAFVYMLSYLLYLYNPFV